MGKYKFTNIPANSTQNQTWTFSATFNSYITGLSIVSGSQYANFYVSDDSRLTSRGIGCWNQKTGNTLTTSPVCIAFGY